MVGASAAGRYTYLPQTCCQTAPTQFVREIPAGRIASYFQPSCATAAEMLARACASYLFVERIVLVDGEAAEEGLEQLAAPGHVPRARHPPVFAADRAFELRVDVGRRTQDRQIDVHHQRGVARDVFFAVRRGQDRETDAFDASGRAMRRMRAASAALCASLS